jgi:hypothetical protein
MKVVTPGPEPAGCAPQYPIAHTRCSLRAVHSVLSTPYSTEWTPVCMGVRKG